MKKKRKFRLKEIIQIILILYTNWNESKVESKVESKEEELLLSEHTISGDVLDKTDSLPKSGPGFGSVEDTPTKTHMQILDLNPTFVYISKTSIDIELCTGFYSISIMAFPEGVEGYGDLKLIDGLWYNDNGFRKYPNFSEYLEQLKEYKFKE